MLGPRHSVVWWTKCILEHLPKQGLGTKTVTVIMEYSIFFFFLVATKAWPVSGHVRGRCAERRGKCTAVYPVGNLGAVQFQ